MSLRPVILFAAGILCAAPVAAREEKPEPHSLRVLPVGNRAPFRQETRDGVRHEIDPPEGSLPPRRVEVAAVRSGDREEGAADEERVSELRLRLGEVSPAVEFPRPEEAEVELRREDGPWREAELAEGGATLVVLWRAGETWDEVRGLSVDDSPGAVPPGRARVINVSPVDIGVIWGNERIGVKPGGSARLTFPEGAESGGLGIVRAGPDGGFETVLQTSVARAPDLRRQWIVYGADRRDARRPIQVLPLTERR